MTTAVVSANSAAVSTTSFFAKPRALYAVVFVWKVFTGGRFTAPFLTNSLGFDETLTGAVFALQSGLGTLVGPVGGTVADRLQKRSEHGRSHALAFGLVVGTVATLLHGVGHVFPEFRLSSEENDNENEENDDAGRSSAKLRTYVILWHVSLRLVYAVADCFILPVVDGITLTYLEATPGLHRTDFGKERLHGAVWWAIASAILGVLFDRYGFEALYFTTPLGLVLCFVVLLLYTSISRSTKNYEGLTPEESADLQVVGATVGEQDDEQEVASEGADERKSADEMGRSLLSMIPLMLGSVYGACFLFSYFALNTGASVVENLIFLYFELLGGTYTMCGITVAVTVVFEIPIFHVAPSLLRRFGTGTMQLVACVAFVVRVIGYTLVPSERPALVLFLEPLHGVTYACSSTASVEFVANATPSGREAGGQGLLNAFRGLGYVLGLSIGGRVEQTRGPETMYRGMAAFVGVGTVALLLGTSRNDRRGRLAVYEQREQEEEREQEKKKEEEEELQQQGRIDVELAVRSVEETSAQNCGDSPSEI